ncbi:hypothetical protein ACP4OV_030059 [Aristida adscensionis]
MAHPSPPQPGKHPLVERSGSYPPATRHAREEGEPYREAAAAASRDGAAPPPRRRGGGGNGASDHLPSDLHAPRPLLAA